MNNFKVLHLESTDVCNLACPLCARETDSEFNKEIHHHLTVEQIQSAIGEAAIKNLDKMFMCGNYGDPAAGLHTLDIYNYFRSVNNNIVLGMNTNGSLRSSNWWTTLGQMFNQPQDYVVFSIDGLQDTNHLYRVNSQWDHIIRNATAFIQAGGSAHWDMLVYKHNEHQIDECEQLARQLGFSWFRAKVSKRPLASDLEYPINWKSTVRSSGEIDCHALREQSIYIDATGRISPCCWLGSRQTDFIKDIAQVSETWDTDQPYPTCSINCTKNNGSTNFANQWQKNVQL
jgi:MoaA/NifB/PqqE/SkfB family radical SAM enzyme